ncbi:MAG: hypothetical protein NVSMB4_18390 [Acidimicrobiales bacterium]
MPSGEHDSDLSFDELEVVFWGPVMSAFWTLRATAQAPLLGIPQSVTGRLCPTRERRSGVSRPDGLRAPLA